MKKVMAFLTVVILSTLPLFTEDILLSHNGQGVILHDDGTWEYSDAPEEQYGQAIELNRQPNQTSVLTSSTKKFRIYFNPSRWEKTKPSNSDAEFGLQNKAKTGYAMAIFDGLELPLETMEAVLISNAQNLDDNARITEKQPCTVNGTPGELVTYTAVGSGIPFTLLTFIGTGDFGSIQFTFYTTTAAFEKLKPDFVEAISGIEF